MPMIERKYLPTFADLVDRLSIVQLKAIFLDRDIYNAERVLIEHDIDIALAEKDYRITAKDIRAVMIIMLANRYIWENEAHVREGGLDETGELRKTHAINGIRNTAKNKLMEKFGGRQDYKIDCLAGDLPHDMGNWRVFDD
jgi:hypothetical protein